MAQTENLKHDLDVAVQKVRVTAKTLVETAEVLELNVQEFLLAMTRLGYSQEDLAQGLEALVELKRGMVALKESFDGFDA